jgi:dipeptidyl aminopeptidase/acylaminoacyl peptidase
MLGNPVGSARSEIHDAERFLQRECIQRGRSATLIQNQYLTPRRPSRELTIFPFLHILLVMINLILRAARVIAIAVLLSFDLAAQSAHRSFRIRDLICTERIDGVSIAPDGQSVAFVRRRSAESQVAGVADLEQLRNDIWLQSAPGGNPRNLTLGRNDRSGAWMPRWSPDGERLAFLSSRGGGITLWVWEKKSGRTQRISAQGIEADSDFRWLDARRILCWLPETGDTVMPLSLYGEAIQRVTNLWSSAARGELTASAVDSMEVRLPQRRVAVIDAATGGVRVIAKSISFNALLTSVWWPAPGGRAVLLRRPEPNRYPQPALDHMGIPWSMSLYWTDGTPVSLKHPLPENILSTTVRWSPDGRQVAFFAYGTATIPALVLFGPAAADVMTGEPAPSSLDNPAKLYRVTLDTGEIDAIPTGELELGHLGAPQFQWSARGDLVFRGSLRGSVRLNNVPFAMAYRPEGGRALGPTPDRKWWILEPTGNLRPLALDQSSLPPSLDPVCGGAAFVGLREGDVWSIDPDTGKRTNLTLSLEAKVTAIVTPENRSDHRFAIIATGPESLSEIADSTDAGAVGYHRINLDTGEISRLPKPSVRTTLVASAPDSANAVYSATSRQGTFLWRTNGSGLQLLAHLNRFFGDIVRPERKVIEYRDLQGHLRKALVALPPDYVEGRKYPLVVEVYQSSGIGSGFAAAISPEAPPSLFGGLDIFPTAGYAYVQPMIPDNVPGIAEEKRSIFMVGSAVLPVVEQLVQSGIADPDRLLVWGWSMGGNSAVSLISQSTRFKAAFAGAGLYLDTDILGSAGGALGGRDILHRYSDFPHVFATPHTFWSPSTETPWWRDGDRLRRNDPFTYLDRIRTPVLLVHGDLDASSSFEQSDDLFRAFASMRKPAQFVRYWGEAHGTHNPANLIDCWERTFAWFDRWGDIARDSKGAILFNNDGVAQGWNGAAPLEPAAFAKFEIFGPGGEEGTKDRIGQRGSDLHVGKE